MAKALGASSHAVTTPEAALAELSAGNARFVAGKRVRTLLSMQDSDLRATLAKGQAPFAVIVTCSDSRLADNLLFDQELGRLFTIREAGNSPDIQGLASVEYALEHLGAKLVVVLGHTGCGAVKAVYEAHGKPLPGNLWSLQAAMAGLLEANHEDPNETPRDYLQRLAVSNAAAAGPGDPGPQRDRPPPGRRAARSGSCRPSTTSPAAGDVPGTAEAGTSLRSLTRQRSAPPRGSAAPGRLEKSPSVHALHGSGHECGTILEGDVQTAPWHPDLHPVAHEPQPARHRRGCAAGTARGQRVARAPLPDLDADPVRAQDLQELDVDPGREEGRALDQQAPAVSPAPR